MADAEFNVLAPQFQLLLDGSHAPIDLATAIIGLRVAEDLTRPGRFTLHVSDVGRVWTKSNKFQAGREVEIKLGYTSATESVIKAEVHSWEVDLAAEGPARLVVQGSDKLHRFTRGPKTRTFLNETDSNIIKKIAQEHGLSAETDDSQAIRPFVLQNNVPDFDFILERAALCGFQVQVQAKKLLFKKPALTSQPVVKLTWGQNVGRIAHEVNTFDQAPKIEARAWDPVNQKLLTAPAKLGDELSKMGGQTVGAKLAKDRFGDVQQYVLSTATSLKEIESAVKAEYNRRAGDFVQIECRVDGNPKIRAGTIVEIEKAGKRLDGPYFVTSVEHIFFTDAGYATEFRARRYALDKGSGAPKDVSPKGLVKAIDGVTTAVNAVANGVEKARACFQAAKEAVEKAKKTLEDAQKTLNNVISAVKSAKEAVENAIESVKSIAKAVFEEAKAQLENAKKALANAKESLLKAADAVGAPPEFKKALESAFKAADMAVGAAQKGLGVAEELATKGGALLDKVEEKWNELTGGGAEGGSELIKKGSNIAPPKIAVGIASAEDEQAWFKRLETTSEAELQPGDIILRKDFSGESPVTQAQRALIHDKGSRFTTHAMLYVGGGRIVHSTVHGALNGIGLDAFAEVLKKDCIVWRPTDKAQAASAVETAQWLATQKIKYSMVHCLGTAVHDSSWGPKATERAKQIATRQAPTDEMMCSETVTFSYQGLADKPGIRLDAMRVSPMRLEDWLNENAALFAFAGAIPQGGAKQAAGPADKAEITAQLEATKTAGEAAKESVKASAEAVASAKDAIGKAEANDVRGAEKSTAAGSAKAQEAAAKGDEAKSAAAEASAPMPGGKPASTKSAPKSNAAGATPAPQGGAAGAPTTTVATPAATDGASAEAPTGTPAETPTGAPQAVAEASPEAPAAAPATSPSADGSAAVPGIPDAKAPAGIAEAGLTAGDAKAPAAPKGLADAKAPAAPKGIVEDATGAAPVAPAAASAGGDAAKVAGAKTPAVEAPKAPAVAAAKDAKTEARGPGAGSVAAGVAVGAGAIGAAVAISAATADAGDSVSELLPDTSGAQGAASAGRSAAGAAKGASSTAASGAGAAASTVTTTASTAAAATKKAPKASDLDDLPLDDLQQDGLPLEELPAAKGSSGVSAAVSQAKDAKGKADKSASLADQARAVGDPRNRLREAEGTVRQTQNTIENADTIAQAKAKGAVLDATHAREIQSEVNQTRSTIENADTIAQAKAKGAVLDATGAREIQSEVNQTRSTIDNADSIAMNKARGAAMDATGARELQSDVGQASSDLTNAPDRAKYAVTGDATNELREARSELSQARGQAETLANTPERTVGEMRGATLESQGRVARLQDGDVGEIRRTVRDAGKLDDALSDDLELPEDGSTES